MNTTTLFLLAFILFFALSANSAPSPSPVLDGYGKNLQTGVAYYVMPAARDGESSGLFSAAVGNFTCPAGVAQWGTDDEFGDPVIFTPVNPKKQGVFEGVRDVNVKFLGSTICHESNVWKFKYDKNIKQYAVMMGGVLGNPGPETLDNWFKIEKTKDGYKFVYCPSVCKVKCKDLGIVLGVNGMRRLAVSKDPLSYDPSLEITSLESLEQNFGIAQLQAKKQGLPLTFTPVNPKKRVIRLSTGANIKFSGPTSCNESNAWRLKYDEAIQQYIVTMGGVHGNSPFHIR
ncbi:miraculin-like protein [Tanacetum coccineum]